jgi:tetratricopeptide (TPR) repeat protein
MKKIGIGLIIAASALAVYLLSVRQRDLFRVPTLSPRSGGAVATSEFLNAERAVAYYREQITLHPEVIGNHVELAQLFLQEARVTGNHHEYLPKAERLLEEALARQPDHLDAMTTKASLVMTLHRFSEAELLVLDVLRRDPFNIAAHGILCDAQIETGKYDLALKTCEKMMTIRPDLRSYSRTSYLRELHGDLHGAQEAMMAAANAGMWGQENRAWALCTLASLYFQEGKPDTAEYLFSGVLEERPGYPPALHGLARVECARGRTDEAERLLLKAQEIMPGHAFLEELAALYSIRGDTERARKMREAVLDDLRVDERDGMNVDREFAAFCSDQGIRLEEALERAKKEYDRRPENIEALDTYAWALHKNGLTKEAVPYMERALRLNSQNPTLHYHAGMIYYTTGLMEQARKHLRHMLQTNPCSNILYTESARSTYESINSIALND